VKSFQQRVVVGSKLTAAPAARDVIEMCELNVLTLIFIHPSSQPVSQPAKLVMAMAFGF